MQVLFDGEIDVHYGFIALKPYEDDLPGPESVEGQSNGICGAAVPGVLMMYTGLHTGAVPVRVELHTDAPPVGADWEDVVEVPFEVMDSDEPQDERWAGLEPEEPAPGEPLYEFGLAAFESWQDVERPTPGGYRARWCASGMDAAYDGTRQHGEPALDRYLLQLWPASPAPDAVLRRSSAAAAARHPKP